MVVGRFPGIVRCGTIASGVPSSRTSSGVLPNARASVWAKTFDISRSWWWPSGLCALGEADKVDGTSFVPWWISW